MNISLQMFLIAADSTSFSRAAEKAFVTPQCFSEHIKRMEEQYNTVLFHRRPQLRLTAEGEIVFRYLRRIQVLEDCMENELSARKSGFQGTVRLGIPTTRGVVMVPKITSRFQQSFPRMSIQVFYDDTRVLEDLLLDRKIDIMLGVDASLNALFRRMPVSSEALYLVMSDKTLKKILDEEHLGMLEEFRSSGMDLHLFQGIPFIQGSLGSTTTIAVEKYLSRNKIQLEIPLSSSNFDVQAELCKKGNYATVCSRFYIRRLSDFEMSGGGPRLCVFPLRNLIDRLQIEIITHRDVPLQEYLSALSHVIKKVAEEEDDVVCSWLDSSGIVV